MFSINFLFFSFLRFLSNSYSFLLSTKVFLFISCLPCQYFTFSNTIKKRYRNFKSLMLISWSVLLTMNFKSPNSSFWNNSSVLLRLLCQKFLNICLSFESNNSSPCCLLSSSVLLISITFICFSPWSLT